MSYLSGRLSRFLGGTSSRITGDALRFLFAVKSRGAEDMVVDRCQQFQRGPLHRTIVKNFSRLYMDIISSPVRSPSV
jgi:hypothetical protein